MIPNLPTGTPPYTRFGTAAIIKYCPSCAAAKPADHIWDWEVLSPSSVTSWLSYTTTFLFILVQVLFFFLPPRPCSQFSFPFFTLPWWPHPLSQLQLSLLRGWLPILYLHFWPVSQASAPQCQLPTKQCHLEVPPTSRTQYVWPEIPHLHFCWRFPSFTLQTWSP